MRRDAVTSALDILGLLLFAAGVAAGVFPWLGWASLAVGGVVVVIGSAIIDAIGARRETPA